MRGVESEEEGKVVAVDGNAELLPIIGPALFSSIFSLTTPSGMSLAFTYSSSTKADLTRAAEASRRSV